MAIRAIQAPLSNLALENMVDLYVRVSSTEQAEEGYSLEEQEARLRSYCEAYGYTIHAVHIDPGFSGSNLDRPGIKKVIKDVHSGACKKVIVWKLDRLSRSQKDTMILLEDVFLANDCAFVSMTESFDTSTPAGRCVVGILASFAQMERENIRIRTTIGRQARVKQGYYHGSHAPIGYKFAAGSNDLIVDAYAAKLVKEVFRRFLSGESISSISRVMADTYGTALYDWIRNTAIRRVLSNPVYMGKVQIKGQLYDGIHESLVSETDWYLAAALLEHNKEQVKRSYSFKTASGNVADNMLTGLLFCGDCSARMYAKKVSNAKKRYICHSVAKTSAAMIKSDNCTNRLHPYTVSELDAIVIDEIKKLALDRSCFDSMVSNLREAPPEDLEGFQERMEEIERQTERLLNLYQTGLVSIEEIQARISDLNDERKKLEECIESAQPATPCLPIETAWERITNLPAVMESGNAEEIHRIIHSLIDKVVVLNHDITIYWTFC